MGPNDARCVVWAIFVIAFHKHQDYLKVKHERKKKKELTNGPNDARCVFWAIFHRRRLPCRFKTWDILVRNMKERKNSL